MSWAVSVASWRGVDECSLTWMLGVWGYNKEIFSALYILAKPHTKFGSFSVNIDFSKIFFDCGVLCSTVEMTSIKVNWFQKQIFLFSFEPKNERNYFLISALASKKSSNWKTYYSTRAIITPSWFETALDYKPRFFNNFLV